jgi:hypothetical protein
VIDSVEAFRRYKHSESGVIVIREGTGTTIHHPSCPHVREDAFLEKHQHGRPYYWTSRPENAERRWASAKRCRHPSDPLAGGTGGPEARRAGVATTAPRSTLAWSVTGPDAGFRGVRAEAARPLPFQLTTESQRELREQLRNRIGHLACRPDEVLHASFFGAKPQGADVENLLLYNVDCSGATFRVASAGIRFEYSAAPMPRAGHPYTYLYRPVPKSKGFVLWRLGDQLAHWPVVRLDAADVDRLSLWLHLARLAVGDEQGRTWLHEFAVSVTLHPASQGPALAAARLVKPILDATVAALQTHGNRSNIHEVATRLTRATGGPGSEILTLLEDARRATLGRVPELMTLRGDGIQLCPSDERCVAAELVIGEPADEGGAWMEVNVRTAERRVTAASV